MPDAPAALDDIRVLDLTGEIGAYCGKLLADLSGNPDIRAEDHPRYRIAWQARNQFELDLRRAVVRSPTRAVVGRLDQIRRGGYVRAGMPALNLVGVEEIWVEANLKESQLTRVRAGQPVTFTVDAYPGVKWQATVDSVSPATGAEFSILPPQNATGNWVKVVQRIPVRIAIEESAQRPPLRAGMTVSVTVDTGRERSASDLVREFFSPARAHDGR